MKAPVASKMGVSAAMPAASAVGTDSLTDNMEPVQRECWIIFNSPEAHARDTGVGVDEVASLLNASDLGIAACVTNQE